MIWLGAATCRNKPEHEDWIWHTISLSCNSFFAPLYLGKRAVAEIQTAACCDQKKSSLHLPISWSRMRVIVQGHLLLQLSTNLMRCDKVPLPLPLCSSEDFVYLRDFFHQPTLSSSTRRIKRTRIIFVCSSVFTMAIGHNQSPLCTWCHWQTNAFQTDFLSRTFPWRQEADDAVDSNGRIQGAELFESWQSVVTF